MHKKEMKTLEETHIRDSVQKPVNDMCIYVLVFAKVAQILMPFLDRLLELTYFLASLHITCLDHMYVYTGSSNVRSTLWQIHEGIM